MMTSKAGKGSIDLAQHLNIDPIVHKSHGTLSNLGLILPELLRLKGAEI